MTEPNSFDDAQLGVHISNGDFSAALDMINAAIILEPAPALEHIKAICLARLGQLDESDALFQKLIEANPVEVQFKADYLDTLSSQNREEDLYRVASEILITHPTHHIAHYYLGLIDFEEEDYGAASIHFLTAHQDQPFNPHYITLYARSALGTGDLETAVTYFKKSYDIYPTNLEALIFGAEALVVNGENDLAIKWLEEATQLDPKNDDLFCRLGLARMGGLYYGKAAQAFRTAGTLDPANPIYKYYFGLCMIQAEKLDDAIKFLTPLATPDAEHILIICLLGLAYQKQRNPKAAKAQFDLAQSLDPSSPVPLLYNSNLLFEFQKYDFSLKVAEKAIALAPELAEAHTRKAEALSMLNLPNAETSYKEAIRLEPYNPSHHYFYGMHLKRTQQLDAARTILETTLTMFPGYKAAREALDTL